MPLVDKDAIRRDVWATAAADPFYRETADAIGQRAMWRYVATPNGVFRTYPAHPSSSNYDPRLRPWWYRALAHPGQLALSTPYTDASGGGIVMTISNIIRRAANDAAPLEAVTGVDFTLGNLQALLDSVADCANLVPPMECALVDSSGLIVLSRELLWSSETPSDLFIGEAYPPIAKDLVRSNYLVKQGCNDFQTVHTRSSYELSLGNSPSMFGTAVSGCFVDDTYALATVPDTNVFLLAFAADSCCLRKAATDVPVRDSEELDFNACDGRFELTPAEAANPTCPPDQSGGNVFYQIPAAPASFPQCFVADCGSISDAAVCLETLGCNLCSRAASSGTVDCRSTSCDGNGDVKGGAPADPCGLTGNEPGGGGSDAARPSAALHIAAVVVAAAAAVGAAATARRDWDH